MAAAPFERRLSGLIVLVLLVAAGGFAPAPAQNETRPVVRVGGTGTVQAKPDQAVARFGVVTQAETAEQARSKNATASKSALNAARNLGVSDNHLRMESLRLHPRREYNPKTKNYEEKGYEATRHIVVQVNRLEMLPRLVAQLVESGANRLEGVDYQLSDRSNVRDRALREAAVEARAKAQLLTKTLNAKLGTVQQIEEQSFDFQDPRPRVSMMKSTSAAESGPGEPEAYAAGEIEVQAQVQVVFNLNASSGS